MIGPAGQLSGKYQHRVTKTAAQDLCHLHDKVVLVEKILPSRTLLSPGQVTNNIFGDILKTK